MTSGTILVSAITSALVTLAIEWLAKPRLEARKERILALHHARRVFEKNVVTVLGNSAKLSTDAASQLPRDISVELHRTIREEINRSATRVEDTTREMVDNLADYLLTYPTDRTRNLISRYVYIARGIAMSSRTQVEKGEILKEIMGPLYTWLFVRRRPVSRVRAVLEIPKILDKYDGSINATNQVI